MIVQASWTSAAVSPSAVVYRVVPVVHTPPRISEFDCEAAVIDRKLRLAARALFVLGLIPATALAQQLTPQQIQDTAASICNTVSKAKGQKSTVDIQGDVKAQLGGLIGKLAGAGLSGKGSLNAEEFEGLSQDATALALEGDRGCRERVFNKMVDKLSAAASPAIQQNIQYNTVILEQIRARLETLETQLNNADVKNRPATAETQANKVDLSNFAISEGFEKKYPLGFALFYSNERKSLYYDDLKQRSSGIKFDPSTIQVQKITKETLHISGFSIVTSSGSELELTNTTFSTTPGMVIRLATIGRVEVDVEALGRSGNEVAWIIGMKPSA